MADKTGIEWTDATWNPVSGCTKISPGCENCYAEKMAHRLKAMGQPGYVNEFKVTCHPEALDQPMKWKKPRRIFVCSMGDLFHDDVPDEFIMQVFNTMANAQCIHGHIFQVLTKRPERMKHIIEKIRIDIEDQRKPVELDNGMTQHRVVFSFPLENIWLGVTVCNQQEADEKIPVLLQIPAAVRFVSIEPMLMQIDLEKSLGGTRWIGGSRGCCGTHSHSGKPYEPHNHGEMTETLACNPRIPHHHHDDRCKSGLDWIICGGESGKNARPMHPEWVRSLRDQCSYAGVPFFFKGWGEWIPQEDYDICKYYNKCRSHPRFRHVNLAGGMGFHGVNVIVTEKVGKKRAGHLIDGEEWRQFSMKPQ